MAVADWFRRSPEKCQESLTRHKAISEDRTFPIHPGWSPCKNLTAEISNPTRPARMLTGELRSQIDAIWNSFWSGGISNPLVVMEQITYLLFLRRLDDLHTLEKN